MPFFDLGHALLIGIADYETINQLPGEVLRDTLDVFRVLTDPLLCGYLPQNVQLLLDRQATKAAILDGLDSLAKRCQPNATALIYISCHGGQLEDGDAAGEYLLPVDVRDSPELVLAQTAISNAEFSACLSRIEAERILVIFDCCHAAGIATLKSGERPILKTLPENYYEALSHGEGRVVYASSRSDETSVILQNASNSLFTHHLLAGLRGAVAPQNGTIRVMDLFHYVADKVRGDFPAQHPVLKCTLQHNFAVALHQGDASTTDAAGNASPVKAQPRVTEATLRLRTKVGDGDHVAVTIARIIGRPSVDARVQAERRRQFPSQSNNSLLSPTLQQLMFAAPGILAEDWNNYLDKKLPLYLRQRDRYIDDFKRLIEVTPIVLNEGTLPATNVQLVLELDGGIRVVRPGERPERPHQPERPSSLSRFDSLGTGGTWMAGIRPIIPIERPAFMKRETEPFKMTDSSVEWRIAHLQHRRPLALDALLLLLPVQEQAEAMTLQLQYQIHATEFVEPRDGTLTLEVTIENLRWEDAEELDDQAEENERQQKDEEWEDR